MADGTPPHSGGRIAARALSSRWSIAAIVVLVVNDHVLKSTPGAPRALTGKLSDVAGLVFFPLLVAAVTGWGPLAERRRALRLGMWMTGAVFASINLSSTAARLVEQLTAGLGVPWRITVDPTDLVALPALAGARTLWKRSEQQPVRLGRRSRAVESGVIVVAALASMATSPCGDEGIGIIGVSATDDAIAVTYRSEAVYTSNDGGRTWVAAGTDATPDADGPQTSACLPSDPDHCFRIVQPMTVQERTGEGSWTTAFEISEGRVDYMQRAFGDSCTSYTPEARDIAASPGQESLVVVAAGDLGLLLRRPDGTWERGVVPEVFAAPAADLGSGAGSEIATGLSAGLLGSLAVLAIAKRRTCRRGQGDGFGGSLARFSAIPVLMSGHTAASTGFFDPGATVSVTAMALIPSLLAATHIRGLVRGTIPPAVARRLDIAVALPLAGSVLATGIWLLWRTGIVETYLSARYLATALIGGTTLGGLAVAIRARLPEADESPPRPLATPGLDRRFRASVAAAVLATWASQTAWRPVDNSLRVAVLAFASSALVFLGTRSHLPASRWIPSVLAGSALYLVTAPILPAMLAAALLPPRGAGTPRRVFRATATGTMVLLFTLITLPLLLWMPDGYLDIAALLIAAFAIHDRPPGHPTSQAPPTAP